jgi:hypothetical protein
MTGKQPRGQCGGHQAWERVDVSVIILRAVPSNRASGPGAARRERGGDGLALLAVRGCFRDSMGEPGKNDRGIYDDAVF